MATATITATHSAAITTALRATKDAYDLAHNAAFVAGNGNAGSMNDLYKDLDALNAEYSRLHRLQVQGHDRDAAAITWYTLIRDYNASCAALAARCADRANKLGANGATHSTASEILWAQPRTQP